MSKESNLKVSTYEDSAQTTKRLKESTHDLKVSTHLDSIQSTFEVLTHKVKESTHSDSELRVKFESVDI